MRTFYSFFVTIVTFLFLSCGQNNSATDSSPNNQTDGVITALEFKEGLVDLSAIQLIDVRTPEEFAEGHIAGALNIDFRDANFESQIDQLDREKPVYVYCKSGGRSGKAYTKMKEKGFSRVVDLEGGYSDWPDK